MRNYRIEIHIIFLFVILVGTASDLQFKAPLEIIKYPDPILRAKNKRVNKFDENLKRLVHEMFDVMYRYA